MSRCEIVDAFPAFLTFWLKVQGQSVHDQVEAWATDYLSPWPELWAKQVDDYSPRDRPSGAPPLASTTPDIDR